MSSVEGDQSAKAMEQKLIKELQAVECSVVDASGGCGSFYRILVVSDKFRGVPLVKQHRMVNDVLKSEITRIHGLTITTRVP